MGRRGRRCRGLIFAPAPVGLARGALMQGGDTEAPGWILAGGVFADSCGSDWSGADHAAVDGSEVGRREAGPRRRSSARAGRRRPSPVSGKSEAAPRRKASFPNAFYGSPRPSTATSGRSSVLPRDRPARRSLRSSPYSVPPRSRAELECGAQDRLLGALASPRRIRLAGCHAEKPSAATTTTRLVLTQDQTSCITRRPVSSDLLSRQDQ